MLGSSIEHSVIDDGAGGAFVAAVSSSSNPSRLWLTRLDATGGVAAGWDPSGLLLLSTQQIALDRLSLARDSTGGVMIAASGYCSVAPLDSAVTLVWRVRDGSPPVVEWGPRVFSDHRVSVRWTDLEPSGEWTQVWLGGLPSGRHAMFSRRFDASGAAAPGVPDFDVPFDSSGCDVGICRTFERDLLPPRRLPDGSIGVFYSSLETTVRSPARRIHAVRLGRAGEVLQRTHRDVECWRTGIEAWDVDPAGRPFAVFGDSGDVWFSALEWSGQERWRTVLRPDSGASVPIWPSAVRLVSDRRGGAWTAHLEVPSMEDPRWPLVLRHHDPSEPVVETRFFPSPGSPWYSESSLRVTLAADQGGRAILVQGALPTHSRFRGAPAGAPAASIQVISRSGAVPPGPASGSALPGAGRAHRASDDEMFVLYSRHSWSQDPMAIQVLRLRAEQPVLARSAPEHRTAALAFSVRGGVGEPVSAHMSLTGAGRARLDVFEVTGRRLAAHDLSHLGMGSYSIALPLTRVPGLLLVRLREGGEQKTARHVQLR